MGEAFEWKKWFAGMVDITRIFKDVGTLIRMVVILCIAYLLFVGGVAIWKRWVPVKKPSAPITATASFANGGRCDVSSGDKTNKFGVITF